LEAWNRGESWPNYPGKHVSFLFIIAVLILNILLSSFHILDSLPSHKSIVRLETNWLQRILLKHFEGEIFKEDRISINIAKVNTLLFPSRPTIHIPDEGAPTN
jgi:hypothetical protein